MSAPYPDRYPDDLEMIEVVNAYLPAGSVWPADQVVAALAAETAAQARRCRVPAVGAPWPADLAEALCRRVHRNLAARALPLGFQTSMADVGGVVARLGSDAEVRRLEGPHRKVILG